MPESTNQVLYRKYRPQNWKDVLGQDHIVSVLEGALKLGNISHAYLFSGSRGLGKTTVARILARELGASENDIIEIDGASNRGVDEARNLREAVRTLPFDSKCKVYIIDEVHMLTKDAFNTLLKTLEEPPAHVIFILATTELDKVLETIVSRCQTFIFKKQNEESLASFAHNIAKKEGFELSKDAAELIAVLGDGSFRDTHGVLQKIFSFSKDKKISVEKVELVSGAPSVALVRDFLFAILEKDIAKGFDAVKKAGEKNTDMDIFLKLVLHRLRAAFIIRFTKNIKDAEAHFGGEETEFLKRIAGTEGAHISSETLSILLDARVNIRYFFISELPLEMALVKILNN